MIIVNMVGTIVRTSVVKNVFKAKSFNVQGFHAGHIFHSQCCFSETLPAVYKDKM